MLYISFRENFWSNVFIATHDAVRVVPPEGIGVEQPLSEQQFLKRVQNKRLLLLIHGYNNEREQIIGAYETIVFNLEANGIVGGAKPAYDEVLGIVWPGGRLDVSYGPAKLRANAIADMVFARLRVLNGSAKSIDVNTHSLGARVALKALQNAAVGATASANPNAIRLRNLWLTAPAVDDDSIEKGSKFFHSTQACRSVYVLHSSKDKVLKFWFPLGEVTSGGLPDQALGLNGPEHPNSIRQHSKNVKVVDCGSVVKEHGDYKSAPAVYAFYADELRTGSASQFSRLPHSQASG